MAITRLLGSPVPPVSVRWYLDSYCPLFKEIARLCEADDSRMLDKALFSYGLFWKSLHSQADPLPESGYS
jgi:hypothetical protein